MKEYSLQDVFLNHFKVYDGIRCICASMTPSLKGQGCYQKMVTPANQTENGNLTIIFLLLFIRQPDRLFSGKEGKWKSKQKQKLPKNTYIFPN